MDIVKFIYVYFPLGTLVLASLYFIFTEYKGND